MSFVSIVGHKNYINVVSDGRAFFMNGEQIDNCQKFKLIDNSHFIAFSGTMGPCLAAVKIAERSFFCATTYDEWYKKIMKFVYSVPYCSDQKVRICVGGLHQNKLRFTTFSNHPLQEIKDFYLAEEAIAYAFLNDIEDSDAIIQTKFNEYLIQYGNRNKDQVLHVQKQLNNYLSNCYPYLINTNIKHTTIMI